MSKSDASPRMRIGDLERRFAHKQLGNKEVLAEVVRWTRKEALLQSLIRNIARM